MNRRAFFATVLTAVAGRPVLSAAKPLYTTMGLEYFISTNIVAPPAILTRKMLETFMRQVTERRWEPQLLLHPPENLKSPHFSEIYPKIAPFHHPVPVFTKSNPQ